MKGFSKCLTPSLTVADREAVQTALGLGDWSYFFLEITGKWVVRAWDVNGISAVPKLVPMTFNSWLEARELKDKPTFAVHYEGFQPVPTPAQRPLTLWEELFPYPLSALSLAFSPRAGRRLEVFPSEAREELEKLGKALERLEQVISNTELSCLWLIGPAVDLPVLFHYVRRRRVRVGIAPYLAPLRPEGGSLPSRERLTQFFGTQTVLYPFTVSRNPSISPVLRAVEGLMSLVQGSSHADSADSKSKSQDFVL